MAKLILLLRDVLLSTEEYTSSILGFLDQLFLLAKVWVNHICFHLVFFLSDPGKNCKGPLSWQASFPASRESSPGVH